MDASVLDLLNILAAKRRDLIESLCSVEDGLGWCIRHGDLVQEAMQAGFESIFSDSRLGNQVAISATGGFARGEMAPYSDADITVIQSKDSSGTIDEAIRQYFRFLTDDLQRILGVQVSYSLRFVSDCEALDPVIRSSLLETSLVCGSSAILEQLRFELERTHPVGEFLVAKIREREAQMNRWNAVPLVAEPNLKEGAGGLRCFHTLNWMRIVLGEAPIRPTPSYQTLIGVRNLLHKVSGRKNDLLNRTRQAEIADITGGPLEALMTRVSESAEALHQRYAAGCERIAESRFLIANGVHATGGEVKVEPKTNAGAVAVGLALATELGVFVPRFDVGAELPANGSAFLHAIAEGLPTIRNLNRTGVLKLVLPDLERCRYLQSDDSIHTYTVYQHTLEVIRFLDDPTKPAWLREISDQVADDGALYLAALLHDVGKVDRTRPHSETGSEVAKRVCNELKLDRATSDLVVWLIEQHLAMTHTMRFRDLENAQTIQEFAKLVGSVDHLNHLTLLTYADVAAVGVGVWTTAQETFLRTLYNRTLEMLSNEDVPLLDPSVSRNQVIRMLKKSEANVDEVKQLIDQMPAYYLAATPPEIVQIHVGYVNEARSGVTTIETFDRHELNGTELTICAADRPGLLSEVLGVLYAFDVSCSGIRACTTSGEPGVILDVITTSYRSQMLPEGMKRSLANALRLVLEQRSNVEDILAQKGKDPNRKATILSWSLHEGEPSILELRCPRGRGVPFRLSRWISEQKWNIQLARIGQWAGKAGATFYVSRTDGKTILNEDVSAAIMNSEA